MQNAKKFWWLQLLKMQSTYVFAVMVIMSPIFDHRTPILLEHTGGRLEYLDNRAVAALIHKRQKHLINLYILPAEQSSATEVATKRQGYNLLHWTNSGMTCWAISDLNGVELRGFAGLVQEAQ